MAAKRGSRGAIRKTTNGRYKAIYHANYRQYSAGTFATYAQARRALVDALHDLERGVNRKALRAVNPTVAELLADWQRAKRQAWSANSLRIYGYDCRHIAQRLLEIRLAELKRSDVERLRDGFLEGTAEGPRNALDRHVGRPIPGRDGTGARAHANGGGRGPVAGAGAKARQGPDRGHADGRGRPTVPPGAHHSLSPKSVQHIVATLSAALEWHLATDSPAILRNPCRGVTVNAPSYRAQTMSQEQFEAFTTVLVAATVDVEPFANLIGMTLYTARRGKSELGALRLCDVDFEAATYRVEQVLLHSQGKAIEPAGDAHSGRKHKRRTFALSQGAAYFAARQIQWLRDHSAIQLGGQQLLFTDEAWQPLAESSIGRQFHRFREAAGLPLMRFHDATRHTPLSLLLAHGESLPTVQAVSGHSNLTTLLNVYAHALPGQAKTAVDGLGQVG